MLKSTGRRQGHSGAFSASPRVAGDAASYEGAYEAAAKGLPEDRRRLRGGSASRWGGVTGHHQTLDLGRPLPNSQVPEAGRRPGSRAAVPVRPESASRQGDSYRTGSVPRAGQGTPPPPSPPPSSWPRGGLPVSCGSSAGPGGLLVIRWYGDREILRPRGSGGLVGVRRCVARGPFENRCKLRRAAVHPARLNPCPVTSPTNGFGGYMEKGDSTPPLFP